VQFRYRKNISNASVLVDGRKKTLGVPKIVYEVSPAELEFEQSFIDAGSALDESYELGDTIKLIDEDLGLDTSLRIVKESHNTEQRMQGTVEISNFVEDVSDTITTIQTVTVAKNNIYNGTSIGPDDGFVAERSDSLVKTFMNATNGIEIDLRASTTASYTPVFYVTVDTAAGTANLYLAGDAILTGRAIIGSGNNIFIADSNGIYLGNATFASAPFRCTMSGALTAASAEINGRFTSKSTADVTLIEMYQDTAGGRVVINDNSGNLNVKLGVESVSATNTGGTLVLYNDGVTNARFEAGCDASDDAGIANCRDSSDSVKASMRADDATFGSPVFYLVNGTGTIATYLTVTEGYIDSEQIATRNWVSSNFTPL
jgi:hypothetical protein